MYINVYIHYICIYICVNQNIKSYLGDENEKLTHLPLKVKFYIGKQARFFYTHFNKRNIMCLSRQQEVPLGFRN